MAKLYFRYGAMGSAKTLNLLAVAHNYRTQLKKVLLLKPSLDVRFGQDQIRSRAGLNCDADYLIDDDFKFTAKILKGISCVLVDEAQFLKPDFVDQLHVVSRDACIPVICYGLRTDFKRRLFPGSQRLLELADSIEEIKSTCHYCNRKAIFNLRLGANGRGVLEGPQIELGIEDRYLPTCSPCYRDKTISVESLREQGLNA